MLVNEVNVKLYMTSFSIYLKYFVLLKMCTTSELFEFDKIENKSLRNMNSVVVYHIYFIYIHTSSLSLLAIISVTGKLRS